MLNYNERIASEKGNMEKYVAGITSKWYNRSRNSYMVDEPKQQS